MGQLYLGHDDMAGRRGHVPSLDGLRAVSISIVLFGHFLASKALFGFSAFGVVVFFFISGFLITRLFFAESRETGRIDIPQFYVRRFFRLYPVIVVYLALAVVVALVRGWRVDLTEVAAALFYFVNYLITARDLHHIATTLPIGALWSLAVEEHFYFVMPFLMWGLRRNPGALAWSALLICLASLAIRVLYLLAHPDMVGTLATYRRSEMRVDAIAVGVLLAAMAETGAGQRLILALASRWISIAALAILAASFALRNEFFKDSLRFTMQSFALFPIFCNLLFSSRFAFAKAFLNLGFMSWIGRLSYSLYVWHGGVGFFLSGVILVAPVPLQPWMRLGLSFLLACLSYYLVERPVLRLRQRAFGKRPSVGQGTDVMQAHAGISR